MVSEEIILQIEIIILIIVAIIGMCAIVIILPDDMEFLISLTTISNVPEVVVK